jgi:hypothetical protein
MDSEEQLGRCWLDYDYYVVDVSAKGRRQVKFRKE